MTKQRRVVVPWSAGLVVVAAIVGGICRYRGPQEELLRRPTSLDEQNSDTHKPACLPLGLGVEVALDLRLPMTEDVRDWLRMQLMPTSDPMNQGHCLHILYLHGIESVFDNHTIVSGRQLLRLFTNAQIGTNYFGDPCLVRTRWGVRFPTSIGRADETHRDQTLAVLGYLGLSRSCRLEVDALGATLADVINDSVANFHIGQLELEWTAWAYSHYLPPQSSWSNRYGETFCFDDVVDSLIERSLPRASCAGTHVLFALTMIARADAIEPILSDLARGQLEDYLREAVSLAARQQQPDGSWRTDWHLSLLPADASRPVLLDNRHERLIVTGHLCEWMLHLPTHLQPPETVYRQAGLWLLRELLRHQGEVDLHKTFCPWTHALFFLKHVSLTDAQGG